MSSYYGRLANLVSFSRLPLSIILIAFYYAGFSNSVLVAWAIITWMTDALDGAIARRGLKKGAKARGDGQALDPFMDDVAIIAGFGILLDAHIIPLWFFAFVLFSRSAFALTRILSMLNKQPFPRSTSITKISGFCLATGQVCLLANVHTSSAPLGGSITTAIVVIMSLILSVSCGHFLIKRNFHALAMLFKTS